MPMNIFNILGVILTVAASIAAILKVRSNPSTSGRIALGVLIVCVGGYWGSIVFLHNDTLGYYFVGVGVAILFVSPLMK